MLIALDKLEGIMLWGDGVLNCAALVASGMVSVEEKHEEIEVSGFLLGPYKEHRVQKYWIELSRKGRHFVKAWKKGDQNAAVKAGRF